MTSRLALTLVAVGTVAAVWLIVTGVRLLTDIHGPGCHGEFPFCTTPTQESVRQTFAMFCGVGVLAYLVGALPALPARRLAWAHVLLAAVILLAVAALIADPVSHLSSEAGTDQWFVSSWPL
jgi:cell division protein FtsW (lipid II flippase)